MSTVQYQISDQIAQITIDRPGALNALNTSVLRELLATFRELAPKFPQELRGAILTGGGEKAFVAGADLREIADLPNTGSVRGEGDSCNRTREFAERGHQVFAAIEALPFPVVAAVNGFALGGGLELALACDVIYAAEGAQLGLPEVGLGLIPGFGGTVRLTRLLGVNRARELIFSGLPLAAREAAALGLVQKVFSREKLIEESRRSLLQMATRGPLALAAAKKAILQGAGLSFGAAAAIEIDAFTELFDTHDMREGLAAFLAKRKPQFQGT
ncbi:MAG: crotonase [Bdellovibrio sp.]|nr:MAG: crotonase [Bdellovibrio sp.]